MYDLGSSLTADRQSTYRHDAGFRGVLSVKLSQGSGLKGLRGLLEP